VFDYPTIGGLAEYLVGQLPDADSAEAVDAPKETAPDSAETTSEVPAEAPPVAEAAD